MAYLYKYTEWKSAHVCETENNKPPYVYLQYTIHSRKDRLSDLYWQWPLGFPIRLSSDLIESIPYGQARDLRKISKK